MPSSKMKRSGVKIKVTAIVPSAGKGERFKSKERKVFANLNKRPLLSYALWTLQSSPFVNDIVLVVQKPLIKSAARLVRRYNITKVKHIIKGGRMRSESVRNGLRYVGRDTSLVLVHDGVRPFASNEVIKKTVAVALKSGAAVSAVPVKATIKVSKRGSFVNYTPERKNLWEAQTPQVFKKSLLESAYKKADGNKFFTPLELSKTQNKKSKSLTGFTDDAVLVESIGAKVKIVKGDYSNIKITTVEDIKIAEALLRNRLI